MTEFRDQYLGAPKILFVGEIHSTHALSWIDLLKDEPINVRAFSLTHYPLPQTLPFPSYVPYRVTHPSSLQRGPSAFTIGLSRVQHRFFHKPPEIQMQKRLIKVISDWKPDIVHCFGVSSAGLFLWRALSDMSVGAKFRLVLQARGGPDLEDSIVEPETASVLEALFSNCDLFFADNDKGYRIARALACSAAAIGDMNRFPGTGGMDVGKGDLIPPSERDRMILVPKAYEGYQSKVLPILEALKLAWPKIKPAQIVLTAMNEEATNYLKRMSHEMKASIVAHARLPRDEILSLMSRARVMVAPSLMDGVPNSLYEAMAYGAPPVVSPLETIMPVVKEGCNVLFADNFDVPRIAEAIVRLMTDDVLADEVSRANSALVQELVGRSKIKKKVLQRYRGVLYDFSVANGSN